MGTATGPTSEHCQLPGWGKVMGWQHWAAPCLKIPLPSHSCSSLLLGHFHQLLLVLLVHKHGYLFHHFSLVTSTDCTKLCPTSSPALEHTHKGAQRYKKTFWLPVQCKPYLLLPHTSTACQEPFPPSTALITPSQAPAASGLCYSCTYIP